MTGPHVRRPPLPGELGIALDPRHGALPSAINDALAVMGADGAHDRPYDRCEVVLPPGGRITSGAP
jgi:hypothetical protein